MEAALELRKNLHGMWAAVAGGWGEHADYTDERAASITEKLLELSSPQPGERVLELACGPGGLGLAAAEQVLPGGEVVLSDVVAEMTAIAAKRAEARGLSNVSTAVLDLEQIDQPDDSYDVLLCREGLMFAVDPAQAAREIRRVLRPGGRVALAVWGPRERNPWLGVVLDSVSAQLGAPIPPPGIPGPFALEDADELAALLTDAELADVAVAELLVPLTIASFDEWWARTTDMSRIGQIVQGLPSAEQDDLRDTMRTTLARFEGTDGKLHLPARTWVAAATA
jgi:SAM-dependent methyltransferase